jgi:hypothetical protein
MAAGPSIDVTGWLEEQLAQASPDLLRSMVQTFAEALMARRPTRSPAPPMASAATNARTSAMATGAATGTPGPAASAWRSRNCARGRTSGLATRTPPPRRGRLGDGRGHQIPARYLHSADGEAGGALGITRLSKSQVSEMAKDLDAQVEAFRTQPLDAGPYTFVAADALVLKVREAGQTMNVHALIATGRTRRGTGRSWACMSPLLRTAPGGWSHPAPTIRNQRCLIMIAKIIRTPARRTSHVPGPLITGLAAELYAIRAAVSRTDGAARPVATLPCWVMRLGYTTAFASSGVA